MYLNDAINGRYSCRKYQPKELTELQIQTILNAACRAPSPKNRQPWRFLVLRKKEKDYFFKLVQESLLKNPVLPHYEKALHEFNSEQETLRIINEADSIILVFNAYHSQKTFGVKDDLFDSTNIQCIGAAIQNMLLMATDLGIGSLWICDIFSCYQQICEEYCSTGQLVAAVALGYSVGSGTQTSRKPLDELLISASKTIGDLIWVGPRESDIYDCSHLFCGSITIFGSNQAGNISYCKEEHMRIDHNVTGCIDDSFWIQKLQTLKKRYPHSKILYYNTEFSYTIPLDLQKDVICCNDISLIKMMNNKSTMRMVFSELVPVIPFQELTYTNDLDLSKMFANASDLIFQELYASGGYGTHLVNINNDSMDKFVGKTFMVSPYYEKSFSVNIHLMISRQTVLYFPGSIQIIHKMDNKLFYLGSDYIAFQTLSQDQKKKLRNYSEILGQYLQKVGYRGVLGFDFLITKDEIMFIEVNPRFQASTPLLNRALSVKHLPSMQEMQIAAFSDKELPSQAVINTLTVPFSMISYVEGTWLKTFHYLGKLETAKELDCILTDGFSVRENIQKNAYLFKMVFNTNCVSVNADYQANIYENLIDKEDDFYHAVMNRELLECKISLLNQGVIISQTANEQILRQGKIRNAVYSAFDLTIFNSLHINCPKNLKFSCFTPWKIDINKRETLSLYYYNTEISDVKLDMEDMYSNNLIKPEIKFSDVCFWATDRLRIHHSLSCCMKNQGIGCKFCEVPVQDKSISIEDILHVVDFYLENANSFRHFLIGGGSEPREFEYKNILKIIKHIRSKSDKDIYVMSLPPKDANILKEYFEAGVTEIGFNIEIFNQNLALDYMPGKGQISREEYFYVLKEAVKYWGATGKVRSLMIVGLESEDSLMQGIRELCQIGVMPILSVFRPIPGTNTEDIVPPSNQFLRKIYTAGTSICSEFALHLGPECPACQNNTLSLPF